MLVVYSRRLSETEPGVCVVSLYFKFGSIQAVYNKCELKLAFEENK